MTGRKAELIPGVYPNVPEDEYFRWKAVSHSKLSPMAGKTPAHCKYAMDHPKERTDAMTLGSAVDCLVLSPTLFNDRFAVAEQCAAMTLKAERCSKTGVIRLNSVNPHWYCSQHATGKTIENLPYTKLTPDQSSTAYAMAKSVLDHPGASVLLAACEETQLSLVWRENNLLCKGRLDGLSSELKTVIDLKTCADASPEAFSRKIADFGYHRQAAMYLRGCSYHGIDVQNYVIIAVENEPPHAVALYTLTESVPSGVVWSPKSQLSPVEYGNHELLRLLDLYEHCEATGEWPSYPEKPVPISLPVWVSQRIERE
jgi:hypothetical protein